MKNVLMCIIVLMLGNSICFAQHSTPTHQVLTLSIYDNNDNVVHKEVLENEAASNFDIPSFIEENKDEVRITVKGNFQSDHETNIVRFDTRSLEATDEFENVCQVSESSIKSFIGVAASSRENFNGVLVNRVVEGSPADLAGIEAGQVILYLHETEIRSVCDLKIAVASCEVGQQVETLIEDNGQSIPSQITIGGQIKNAITFKACKEEALDLKPEHTTIKVETADLVVYPNPTRGETTLNFVSDSKENLKVYLLDVNGSILLNQEITDFSGRYQTTHSFETLGAGTYFFMVEQNDVLYKETVINLKD